MSHSWGWDTLGCDNISSDVSILGINLSPVGEIFFLRCLGKQTRTSTKTEIWFYKVIKFLIWTIQAFLVLNTYLWFFVKFIAVERNTSCWQRTKLNLMVWRTNQSTTLSNFQWEKRQFPGLWIWKFEGIYHFDLWSVPKAFCPSVFYPIYFKHTQDENVLT